MSRANETIFLAGSETGLSCSFHSPIIEPMKQVFASVISRVELMPDVHLLRVEAAEIAPESRPGQFVTIRCGEDSLLRRPFSIHKVANGQLKLLFATVGQGTQWLAHCAEGDLLDILGPLGNGFEIYPDSRNLLLMAGGIGIAPLVCLAEKVVADGFSVKLILGAATASQLYPEAIDGVELIRITDDGSAGKKGLATDWLPSLVKWADQIFACGPIPMYLTMAGMADEFEGKSVQILLEQVMGCGVGACRGCAVPTNRGMKMVCQDGPVFDLREIDWAGMAAPGISRFKESD